ncbi:hypothetical protein PGTUg99_025531 [Puccinia graminis f. sp. tritici]|uniref:Uncharacterized protein n=1 Tax=Puccinia graminis f. sp. tritici TaxID=56615 RepID=A0A5B0P2I3_PUCGR|nr:hypothetical protein PGTUg99_025531 [Puccinia graminis f. sp. tritici]
MTVDSDIASGSMDSPQFTGSFYNIFSIAFEQSIDTYEGGDGKAENISGDPNYWETEPFLATIPSFRKYNRVQSTCGLKDDREFFVFGGDSNVLKGNLYWVYWICIPPAGQARIQMMQLPAVNCSLTTLRLTQTQKNLRAGGPKRE